MFEKILFPVDFSETSEYAISLALDIARKFNSRIYIQHVMDETIIDPLFAGDISLDSFRDSLERKATKAMDEFVENHVKQFENYDVIVASGIPFQEILKTARSLKASLIAIGTHGRTGLEKVLFGSTAEKVIREAPCPVLAVRLPRGK